MKETAYETVIGLEVHAQLLTQTKLFCGDTTKFGEVPNTQVSAISLGHPGTLPRLNKQAIRLAVTLGLATKSTLVQHNYFARKNYFYPDLPKGYQISQHTTPVCLGGEVEIKTGNGIKSVRLNRIHMEEDAGKSLHDGEGRFTQLDFNRAGTPLLEIVTEPDLRSAEEAAAFVTALRKLVRRLGVCDGNMEEGSLRCDVNVSVRRCGEEKLGTKVEIKNLNSIRFVKKAVEYESRQLKQKLERGETILQQTKGWDEASASTYVIRTKEDEDDYRYFPEPDLPPFFISNEEIERIRQTMPPLPAEVQAVLETKYALAPSDAALLAEDDELVQLFETIALQTGDAKAAANWLNGPVRNHLLAEETSWSQTGVPPSALATLIGLVEEGRVNYGTASQQIFSHLLRHPHTDLAQYIEENGLRQQSAGEVEEHIEAALRKHADKIAVYKKGKKGLLAVFVGEVMKLSKGKAAAEEVAQKLKEKLDE